MIMSSPLLYGAAFSFMTALVYGHVGRILVLRDIGGANRLARIAFAVWWYALAASSGLGGVAIVLGSAGVREPSLYVALTFLNLLAICIALWGLLYYLLFLFTGSGLWFWPLAVLYLAVFAVLLAAITASGPTGVAVGPWRVELLYEHSLAGIRTLVLLGLIILPPFFGAVALLLLSLRIPDPSQRIRLRVVSVSIVIWFGSSFVASSTGLAENTWWQIVNRSMGLAAALVILAAYHPPARIWQRFRRRTRDGGTSPSS